MEQNRQSIRTLLFDPENDAIIHPSRLISTLRNAFPPSYRLKGKSHQMQTCWFAKHLQPAARKAGITGHVGFHTPRRTLAGALAANGNHPKLLQELLRHSNVKTTLELYAKAITPAKLEAQGWALQQLSMSDLTDRMFATHKLKQP
jgi:integrase